MGKPFIDWLLHIPAKKDITAETALFDEPGEYECRIQRPARAPAAGVLDGAVDRVVFPVHRQHWH